MIEQGGLSKGRWPANVIVQHSHRCRLVGSKEVGSGPVKINERDTIQPAHEGFRRPGRSSFTHHPEGVLRSYGAETVDAWECVEGCPVRDLDEQSGVLLPQGAPKKKDTQETSFLGTGFGGSEASTFYGDSGGASRFFKQIAGEQPDEEGNLVTPPLTTIHLVRKPLVGTVAANALKHGTGSLNIDGTRLGGGSTERPQNEQNNGQSMHEGTWQGGTTGSTKGRWPANVILQHADGCELVGHHYEDFLINVYADEDGGGNFDGYAGNSGAKKAKEILAQGNGQMVEQWACVEGCPVADLDEQSGDRRSAGGRIGNKEGGIAVPGGRYSKGDPGYGDFGGASRYFKQVRHTVEQWDCAPGCPVADLDEQSGIRTNGRLEPHHQRGVPRLGHGGAYGEDQGELSASAGRTYGGDTGGASRYFKQTANHGLIEYLRTMVSTPDQAAFFIDMKNWPEDMAEWENNSICGLVVRGAVQQKHVDEFMRLLPPGGHLMLIAPDEQPTGHTGAILVEDSGFEIRDAILWVRGPGRLHYVAKAARKEREAGCQHLKGKAGHEAVERKEGSAGVENPRAGAGRTAKHVKNFHPTVKPIGLMVRLLAGVPKDRGPVLDLFMGSGTTGIGCSMTGHDFFGIERGPEYLEIGDARIRHWDRAHVGWQAATIISDHEVEAEVVKPLTLDDLFD